MSKIHIFIDGTWLFKVCGAGAALSYTTDSPTYPFLIDWNKFDSSLQQHTEQQSNTQIELGTRFFCTSIFNLPNDFDDWSNRFIDITEGQIKKTKQVVFAKNRFVQAAINSGYSELAIFRPEIKSWIIPKLDEGTYQEKQVDTTVVALLVKSAITQPEDYHAVVTGDADMIPAIKVAYPEYTKNVLIVSTHPDELDSIRRQSSFSYFDFSFDLQPFFLQANAENIITGDYVYRCSECGKIFTTKKEVPQNRQPRCRQHRG
jgi:hypothetical protein